MYSSSTYVNLLGAEELKILIIENQPLLCESIEKRIRFSYPVVDLIFTNHFEKGEETYHTQMLTLILIGNCTSEESTPVRVSRLRHSFPTVPIMVLSALNNERTIHDILNHGADRFVSTFDSLHQFDCALHALIEGKTFPGTSVQPLRQSFPNGSQQGNRRLDFLHNVMSPREMDVFRLLGNELTRKQIADQLCISLPTVETHISRIKNKLNLESNYRLLCFALKVMDSQSYPRAGECY